MVMDSMSSEGVSGLILAGGEGRRMSGRDKGLISLSNKPLIEYAINCMASLVDDLSISCNRNQVQYAAYQLPCLADKTSSIPDSEIHFSGPMAGIASGLTHAKHDWLLVMPCDTPLMSSFVMAQLIEVVNHKSLADKNYLEETQAIIFSHQGLQPLHGLYHKSILPVLEKKLAENNNALQKLLRSMKSVHAVEAQQAEFSFNNANDINELNIIEKILSDKK